MYILRRGIPATSLLFAFEFVILTQLAPNAAFNTTLSAEIVLQQNFTSQTVPAYSSQPDGPLGTYWSLQRPNQPPLPGNPFPDLPVYVVDPANHVYLIDDSSVDYFALAEFMAMDQLSLQSESGFALMSLSEGGGESGISALYSPEDLWLEFQGFNSSTRSGRFVIHPPESEPDSVYDLFSTTNLNPLAPGLNGTNWQWVLRCSPGQTNLAVPDLTAKECYFRLGRTNDTDGDQLSDALELLVNHSDPTNPFTAGDGIPDFWMWENFGSLQPADGDFDNDGSSNLEEYQGSSDPNTVGFTARLGNQHFNTTNVTGSFVVLDGVPAKWAVLVNSTNENAATWQTYAENMSFTLGATDTVYEVRLGLRGRASDSVPTWIGTRVSLDRVAPTIGFTNPATSTVTQPLIQLQGYAVESLARVTFDVSNAVEVVTNREGLLIGQYFDTNSFTLTIDYFQCFDISLTNGVNAITVYVTDLASNLTTTNFTISYLLPTNPPVSEVEWPTNGTHISGTNFNWCGRISDPTVTVRAQSVDGNGNTNIFEGVVERNGKFWINNLPLTGTNTFDLTATDSGGNVATTNITVFQHSLVLTLDPVSESLWLPKVSVSGTINDVTYALWVNGVKGSVNTNGTWTATEVPVAQGGMASFTIKAFAPGELQPDGSTN